jgi:hypothetical protein
MCDFAARLVNNVMPDVPVRQWVLTVPHRLRAKLAVDPELNTLVLHEFIIHPVRSPRDREIAQIAAAVFRRVERKLAGSQQTASRSKLVPAAPAVGRPDPRISPGSRRDRTTAGYAVWSACTAWPRTQTPSWQARCGVGAGVGVEPADDGLVAAATAYPTGGGRTGQR